MNVVCLDMEGVLVPEIWIAFAEASGIPELPAFEEFDDLLHAIEEAL